MKKIIQVILISLFTGFSFFYTDKIIEFSKKQDPIMTMINDAKTKYKTEPINAVLSESTMLVGSSGKEVDADSSYEKMKKLEEYNENLLEYINIKPSITKKDNLEKLITGKNTISKEISLVFNLENLERLDELVYILNENNTKATFFIDGKVIESNLLKIKSIFHNNLKLGLYSYDNNYNETSLRYMQGLISNNTSYSNYCLFKNNEFLNSCRNFKISTIKPEKLEKNLYNYMKEYKNSGSIYQIEPNNNNIKELNSTLIYLKQKGYKIEFIDDLLKE